MNRLIINGRLTETKLTSLSYGALCYLADLEVTSKPTIREVDNRFTPPIERVLGIGCVILLDPTYQPELFAYAGDNLL